MGTISAGGGGRHLIIMRGNFLPERRRLSEIHRGADYLCAANTRALHFLIHTIDFSGVCARHAGIFKRPGYLPVIIPKRTANPSHDTKKQSAQTRVKEKKMLNATFGQALVL